MASSPGSKSGKEYIKAVYCHPAYLTYMQRRQWHPTPVLLPGNAHGWRNLVGCSPWGLEESDTTERLHFHFSLSCIGEGNGNPLQCPCLENPRDRGAWWATIYGVAQSRTWLKRLSSSSSRSLTGDWTWALRSESETAGPAGDCQEPTFLIFQVNVLIWLQSNHEKHCAGGSTTLNQDCWEKYK